MGRTSAPGELKIDVKPLRDAFIQLGNNLGVLAEDMANALRIANISWSKLPAVQKPTLSTPNEKLDFDEALLVFSYTSSFVPVNAPEFFDALVVAEDFMVYLKGLVEETT